MLFQVVLIAGHKLRDYRHDVADNCIVGNGVDWSVGVGVDADNLGALFHAGAMLYSSADATGYV